MPDTYKALVGLTLPDGKRLEAGETTTATLPEWVIAQGHVVKVEGSAATVPAAIAAPVAPVTAPEPVAETPAPAEQAPEHEEAQS